MTAFHLHVSSKSVEVVVGLLTFNNAVVFKGIKLAVLQQTQKHDHLRFVFCSNAIQND